MTRQSALWLDEDFEESCGCQVGAVLFQFDRKRLLKAIVLGNLVTLPGIVHTRFTYHRTWETGLEVAA